jgi:hypothetical protein
MNPLKVSLIVVISILFVTACSTTQQAYIRNVEMYFESNTAVNLSTEEIRQSAADLIYVKNGDRSQVTMALAFIENEQYKWVSRDGVMFITENGRLVRTLNLDKNLLYVSNLLLDPLALPSFYDKDLQWDRVIDTQHGEYGVNVSSSTSVFINQLVDIEDAQLMTKKYLETVHYNNQKHGKHTWINTFWLDQSSGQLLKSSQKMSPHSNAIEITYISRALRLLEK